MRRKENSVAGDVLLIWNPVALPRLFLAEQKAVRKCSADVPIPNVANPS